MTEIQTIIDLAGKVGGWTILCVFTYASARGWVRWQRELVALQETHQRDCALRDEALIKAERRAERWETLATTGTRIAATATDIARQVIPPPNTGT